LGEAQGKTAGSMSLFLGMMFLIVVMLFDLLKQPTVIFLTVPLALIGVTRRETDAARSIR
jgi:multidrug efflux pump subunit AcrB